MTKNEQKLLDLFNDYNFIVANDERDTYRPRTEKDWLGMSKPYQAYIVCKHYEFIRWLCYDNHINWKKCKRGVHLYKNDQQILLRLYEGLIMILSIQDEPLKFLSKIIR